MSKFSGTLVAAEVGYAIASLEGEDLSKWTVEDLAHHISNALNEVSPIDPSVEEALWEGFDKAINEQEEEGE